MKTSDLNSEKLYKKAVKVFKNETLAKKWLNEPAKALGGSTPLEYTQTKQGAKEVENLLGRIEHGVFT